MLALDQTLLENHTHVITVLQSANRIHIDYERQQEQK